MTLANPDPPEPTPPQFAVLELKGHLRLAGRVSEQTKFGATMGRIDVIGADGGYSHTRYFTGDMVYTLSYVSEAAAVAAARHCASDPVKAWELPQVQPVRALPAAAPTDGIDPIDPDYTPGTVRHDFPSKPMYHGEPFEDPDRYDDDDSA